MEMEEAITLVVWSALLLSLGCGAPPLPSPPPVAARLAAPAVVRPVAAPHRVVWSERGQLTARSYALSEHHGYVSITTDGERGLQDTLYRVDLRNGFARSRDFVSLAVVSASPLLVRRTQGETLALDTELETLWTSSQDPMSHLVGVQGGLMLLTHFGPHPYTSAVDVSTGEERLRTDSMLGNSASMVGTDFIAFVSADGDSLLFFDPTTGEATGQVSLADVVAGGAVAGRHLVVAFDDRIVAFDRTGAERWSRQVRGLVVPAPDALEQVIVVEGRGGRDIVALSADDGLPRWRYRSPESFSQDIWFDGDYVWLANESGQILFGDTGQPGLQCRRCVRSGSDFFRLDVEGAEGRVTRVSEGGVEVWRSELLPIVDRGGGPRLPEINRHAVALCGAGGQLSLLDRGDGQILERMNLPTEWGHGDGNRNRCTLRATEDAFLAISGGGATVIAFGASE